MSSLSIFKKQDLIQAPPAKPASSLPAMRPFGDAPLLRNYIYDDALDAARNPPVLSNDKHSLRLVDVDYADPETFTKRQKKEATLRNQSLARRMRGTWELLDNE